MFNPGSALNPLNALKFTSLAINKTTLTITKILNSVIIPLAFVLAIVYTARYPEAIGLIASAFYFYIFSSSVNLANQSVGKFQENMILFTFGHIGSIVCIAGGVSLIFRYDNRWKFLSLVSFGFGLLIMYLNYTNLTTKEQNAADEQSEVMSLDFWRFFELYKAYYYYKKDAYYSKVENFFTKKIESETVGNILQLDQLLRLFKLTNCSNEHILRELCREIEILFAEYFDIKINLPPVGQDLSKILSFEVSGVPKKEYLGVIDYLIEHRRFFKSLLRANVIKVILDGQIDKKTIFSPEAIKNLGLVKTDQITKTSNLESSAESNLNPSAEFDLDLKLISSYLKNLLMDPKNEARLFVDGVKDRRIPYRAFYNLLSFPYIGNITDKGTTIFKTRVGNNKYFKTEKGDAPEEDFYYYIIDSDRTAKAIEETLFEIKQELIKELINSREAANSTQVRLYIYELLTTGQISLEKSARKVVVYKFFNQSIEEINTLEQEEMFRKLIAALGCKPQMSKATFQAGVNPAKILFWMNKLTKPKSTLRHPFLAQSEHVITFQGEIFTLKTEGEADLAQAINRYVGIRSWAEEGELKAKQMARSIFNRELNKTLVQQRITLKTSKEWQYYLTERGTEFDFNSNPTQNYYSVTETVDNDSVQYILKKDSPVTQEEGGQMGVEQATKEYMKVAEWSLSKDPEISQAHYNLTKAIASNIDSCITNEIEQNLSNLVAKNALQKPYSVMEHYNNPIIAPINSLKDISEQKTTDPFGEGFLDITDSEISVRDELGNRIYGDEHEIILNKELVVMYTAINNGLIREQNFGQGKTIILPSLAGSLSSIEVEANRMLRRMLVTGANLSKDAIWQAAKECYSYARLIKEIQLRSLRNNDVEKIYEIYGNYYLGMKNNDVFVNFSNMICKRSTFQYIFTLHSDLLELTQKKINSAEIKQYLQYQTDLYKIIMVMEAVWFIVLFEDSMTPGKSNIQELAERLERSNFTSLSNCEDVLYPFHRDHFSKALARKVKIVLRQEEYRESFFGSVPPNIIYPKMQTLEENIDMIAAVYIPEYIRLLVIMNSLNQNNIAAYSEYYKQARGVSSDPVSRFSESCRAENYKAVKKIFLRDPLRFIPTGLKRLYHQPQGENFITPLDLEPQEKIARRNPKFSSFWRTPVTHDYTTFTFYNSRPWGNFISIDEREEESVVN